MHYLVFAIFMSSGNEFRFQPYLLQIRHFPNELNKFFINLRAVYTSQATVDRLTWLICVTKIPPPPPLTRDDFEVQKKPSLLLI